MAPRALYWSATLNSQKTVTISKRAIGNLCYILGLRTPVPRDFCGCDEGFNEQF